MPLERTVRLDPLLNSQVGDYQVKGRLGEGGMGLVYEAYQPMIGKAVAIKVLHPEFAANPIWMRRFVDEARAVNAIGHRGIVDIFGFGALPDGRQYLVMELLSGEALDVVLARKLQLSASEAVSILTEVVDALAAAHGVGIVHRDLKPSNIFMVKPHAGSPYVKLLDFGLAKQRARKDEVRATQNNALVGTPEYMSPEQARSEEVSPRSDLYALGVIAFELLTGRLPYEGSNAIETLSMHMTAKVPRVSHAESTLPDSLDELVFKLMQKEPAARPPSAGAVASELQRIRRWMHQDPTRVGQTMPGQLRASLKPVVAPRAVPGAGRALTAAGAAAEDEPAQPTLIGRSIEDLDEVPPTVSALADEPAASETTLVGAQAKLPLAQAPVEDTQRSTRPDNTLSVQPTQSSPAMALRASALLQKHRNPLLALASAGAVLVFGLTLVVSRQRPSEDEPAQHAFDVTARAAEPPPAAAPAPSAALQRRLSALEEKLARQEQSGEPPSGARSALVQARKLVEAATLEDEAASRTAAEALDAYESQYP